MGSKAADERGEGATRYRRRRSPSPLGSHVLPKASILIAAFSFALSACGDAMLDISARHPEQAALPQNDTGSNSNVSSRDAGEFSEDDASEAGGEDGGASGEDGGAGGKDGGASGEDGGASGEDGGASGEDGGAKVPAPSAASIALPIEVLGAAGTIESIAFALDDPSGIDRLYLQAHRVGYAEGHSKRAGQAKASVRFNGGTWHPITNATADVAEPARSYGGIGGGFSTVELRLPATSLVAGQNQVDFRFEGSDGLTLGYRILELNLLRDGAPVLPDATFRREDPAAREPVQADVAAGRTLWYQRDHLQEPLSGNIKASCSDCHAEDGRDLAYFHYSNRSIIERSVFHGLSRQQGEHVAAYIRSLNVPAPAMARPWNPPYQPGPGLEARPAEEWAAGAGLGAVLDSDAAMLQELAPGTGAFDARATLNVRQMRVALQFPDWNAWLPAVHPLDVWGQRFTDGYAGEAYERVKADLPALAAAKDPALIEMLGRLDDGVRRFIGQDRTDSTGQGHWRTLEGRTVDAIPHSIGRERAKFALAQWMGVKTWEVVQQHGLETLSRVLRPPVGGVERGERLGWPTDGQSVWANAPHMTADDKRAFAGQSEVVGLYESSVWYQLQLTLNAAMRLETDTRPVDWAYHFRHMYLLAEESAQPQALRYVQGMIKAYQARDNGLGPTSSKGWQLRFLHPWQMYSTDRGDTFIFDALDTYKPGLHGELLTDFLEGFLDLVETRPEFDLARWPRRSPSDYNNSTHAYWFALEHASYRPRPYSGSGDLFEQPNYNHADAFFRLLPRLTQRGVSADTVKRLISWCKRAWPNGDWDSLRP